MLSMELLVNRANVETLIYSEFLKKLVPNSTWSVSSGFRFGLPTVTFCGLAAFRLGFRN
ncbi:hypothetical protein D3C86_1909040 [compost metagenome]